MGDQAADWREELEEELEEDREEEDLLEGGYLEESKTQRDALPVLRGEGGHTQSPPSLRRYRRQHWR